MTYTKNTWVDQAGQVRYTETDDSGYKIFTANYDNVTELGTPVNATNMNHIEQGVYDNDIHIGDLTNLLTTVKTDVVSAINEIVTTPPDLSGKADVDLTNAVPTHDFATALNTAQIRTVVTAYRSGTEWYRVWSDGWIEQGGVISSTNFEYDVTFHVEFNNTNYTVMATYKKNDVLNGSDRELVWYPTSTTKMKIRKTSCACSWCAYGY